ncbi:MAG TPA: extracellular solute-binding protein [Rugosimonospora sp.]|jgi:putative spermidine/putrescine transport system substrate-binding protein
MTNQLSRRALLGGSAAAAAGVLLSACGSGGSSSGGSTDKVTASEWGGVWDKALNGIAPAFKAQSGITVVNAVDDENGLVKVQQNPTLYDLAWLTADKAAQGLAEGALQPIDTGKVTGYADIYPNLTSSLTTGGKVAGIPVSWGVIGILYRTDLVPFEITSWKDLWRPELKGAIGIQAMPALGAAMTLLTAAKTFGTGLNDVAAGWKAMAALKPNVQYQYSVSSDPINKLADGSLPVAISFADFGLPLASKKVKVVVPADGAPWSPQVACIPKRAGNAAGAYKFVNYLLDPTNQVTWVKATAVAPANSKTQLPSDVSAKLTETQSVADNIWKVDWLTVGKNLNSWAQQWQQTLS